MNFLTSFFDWLTDWLTLRDTPYLQSQSNSIRAAMGVNGNKIQPFCIKYTAEFD